MVTTPEPRRVGGIDLPALNHIGAVVRDVDEAIRRYHESLGVQWTRVFEYEFSGGVREGRPMSPKLRIAFGSLGTVLFELITPLNRESIHYDFLERHGEGIQHLGFVVPDLKADLAKLAAVGVRILWEAPIELNQSYLAYVEGDAAAAAVIELIQDSPGQQAFYERIWSRTRRPV